ncbi:GET4 protein, partial [Agelaius phoeniceus]|nr:GET4 protein [Agelaius phoeniceus]
FLLLAAHGGKLTVRTVLCEQYHKTSLKKDPLYNEYLDRIGQLFFRVPPEQTSSWGGLL